MRGEVSYRQIVLTDPKRGEVLRIPLLAPVNDLLGENPLAGPGNLAYLHRRYGTAFSGLGAATLQAPLFRSAAKRAVRGHLDETLAPHIGRLQFAADGTLSDVPDLLALGAWALLEAVRRQPLKLYTCPRCKRPWLGAPDEKSRYCQRPAPGNTKDCRTLDYERRVAGDASYRNYRREYKRVTEMQRRGAIDLYELYRWREHNTPAAWTPFGTWKERDDAS